MFAVNNQEIKIAQNQFEEIEGCDICPEAGAAIAALIRCVRDKTIDPEAAVMLNITGGRLQKNLF